MVRINGSGNISAARHRYPQGGSPKSVPWWQQLIWIITLLVFVLIIWVLVEKKNWPKKKKNKNKKDTKGKINNKK